MIYNSAVGAGINFSVKEHFSKVFSYVNGNVIPARDIVQMINRIRQPIDRDVVLLVASNVNRKTNALLFSREYAKNNYLKICPETDLELGCDFLNVPEGILMSPKIIDDMHSRLAADNIQEKRLNCTNANIMTMLKILIEAKGNTFTEDYTDCVKTKNITETELNKIVSAKTISDDEIEVLEQKLETDLTQDESLMLKKGHLRNELNLGDNTPDDMLKKYIKVPINKRVAFSNLKRRNENIFVKLDEEHEMKCNKKMFIDNESKINTRNQTKLDTKTNAKNNTKLDKNPKIIIKRKKEKSSMTKKKNQSVTKSLMTGKSKPKSSMLGKTLKKSFTAKGKSKSSKNVKITTLAESIGCEKPNPDDNFVVKLISAGVKNYDLALDKTLEKIKYDHSIDTINLSQEEFDEITKDLEYTDAELLSLESRGKLDDIYDVMKTVLIRYGLIMNKRRERKQIKNEKITNIRYEIYRDEIVWGAVYNNTVNEQHKYKPDFIERLKTFNECDNYLCTNK